jgi:Kef-type K+ transport system membrane component KefB
VALLLSDVVAVQLAFGTGLPRLTGYLLVGVVVGPYALAFIPAEGVQGLELV